MEEPQSDDALPIAPLARPVRATVRVPGSKSLTNRALLIAALADGRSTLTGALRSDDTRYMAGALRALGIAIDEADDADGARFTVHGRGASSRPPSPTSTSGPPAPRHAFSPPR